LKRQALIKKLRLRAGQPAAVVNAPEGYVAGLEPLPQGTQLSAVLNGRFDLVQLFVKNQAELEAWAESVVAVLRPAGRLWMSFSKGLAGLQTDLTRDRGWDRLQQQDLKWISLVSIDDTWSAFSLRLYKAGEARQTWQ
jgi:hypothetical protein